MTAQHDQDREAVDAAAREAAAIVAASYLLETAGRPLNAQQRAQRTRAERLARVLQQQATRRGRP